MCAVRVVGWLGGWVDRCLDRWVMDGHSMDCGFRVGVLLHGNLECYDGAGGER